VDLDPASQHDADLWGSMRIQILIRMWIRNASGDTMVLNLNMPQHKLATSQKREKQTKCGEKEILKMATFTPYSENIHLYWVFSKVWI
jgi:broad specificity polyphosphatase/5'/3'-nucleotidase SurE